MGPDSSWTKEDERVLTPSYPLGTQVEGRADEGTRKTVDEFSRHSKVTELDLALLRDEDVRRFDICDEPSVLSQYPQSVDSPRWMILRSWR